MSVLPQLERDLLEVARRRLPSSQSDAASIKAARRRRGRFSIGRLVPVAAVAIAVGVAVIALTSLRHGPAASPPLRPATVTPTQSVAGLIGGVPQSGVRLGRRAAPVRVTFYGDLECAVCRQFVTSPGFVQFVSRYVRHGEANVVFRSFCTSTCNTSSSRVFDVQQAAAYAAGRQSRFWQYALLFYRDQRPQTKHITARYLTHLAERIPGLNVKRWQTERKSTDLVERVRREEAAAIRSGVFGTPTLQFRGHKAVLTLASAEGSSILLRAVRAAEHGCPRHWRAVGFAHCHDFV